MIMNKYTAFLFFALTLTAFSSRAQVKLNNVGVGVSYWERSYANASERAFFTGYEAEEKFTKGGILPTLSAELNLYRGLALDGRVGLWNGKFENQAQFGDLVVDEKIEQTIIPLSLGLVYNFDGLIREDLNFFTGVGLNRYFIQNKVERVITGGTGVGAAENFSGNNYGAYAKAGVEWLFSDSFGLALDARYNNGYYNQNFQPETDAGTVKEKVSVRGFELGLSLRYRFADSTDAPAPVTEDEE